MSTIKIFVSGFIQVFLVGLNTVFISKSETTLAFLAGYLIAQMWMYNVKRVVAQTTIDKQAYAFGSALGVVVGMHTANFLSSLFPIHI